MSVTGRILFYRDQCGHAAAFEVRSPYEVARSFGRDHRHVDIGRRLNEIKTDVEAVREEQALAGAQVRRDVGVVDALLLGVGEKDHDDVGFGARLSDRQHA